VEDSQGTSRQRRDGESSHDPDGGFTTPLITFQDLSAFGEGIGIPRGLKNGSVTAGGRLGASSS